MLFAAFISAYIVRQSGSDWSAVALPPVLWLNTVVLGAVSVAIELAWRGTRRMLTPAVVLGAVFLYGQAAAWAQLAAGGVSLATGPYGAFFYVLSGAHAVHVFAAWILLLWAATHASRGHQDRTRGATLAACRTFWHFLGGLWLLVFGFVTYF
jgi:cytochrome c oxidase subunit 3